MWAVTFSTHGDPSVLRYEEIPDPVPGPGEALVRVGACGVNHIDLDVRAGRSRYAINLPHVLGREAAGEVVAVGPDLAQAKAPARVLVRSYFTCGGCMYCRSGRDNHCPRSSLPGVHCWGGYAEFMRAPARELIALPDGLSLVDAAASQVAFGTAWRALVVLAQLQAGQTVLVLGAGGGVGSAAVQVAALRGARVLAVTRRPENGHLLRSLRAEPVVSHTASEMIEQVRSKTEGYGADIVIDSVGGDYSVAALSLLAPDGRVIVCGAHTGEVVSVDLVKLFRNQSYLIGSRRAVRADLEHVLPLLASGVLRPVVDQTAPLSAASDVHRRMEKAEHTGKMVLVPEMVRQ